MRSFGASGVNEQRIRLRSCRANTPLVHRVNSLLARFELRTHRRLRVAGAPQLAPNLLKPASVVSMKCFLKPVFVAKQFYFLAAPDLLMKDAIVE
ncbi:hypothetical protein ABVT39_014162 [Epinephelus coioides]